MLDESTISELEAAEAKATPWRKGYMGGGRGWPECWAKHFKTETDIAWPVYNDDAQTLDKPSAVFDSNEDQQFYYLARNNLRAFIFDYRLLKLENSDLEKENKALDSENQSLRSQLAVAVEALKEVEKKDGMTMLGECCVDKTCKPYFDPPAHCTHNYGVARGFSDCAGIAREALAKIEKETR